MSEHSINYSNLFGTLYNKAHKLSDVEHRIEKVAFDVVRFKDGDDRANLWQIQSAEDGEQYIVSMYEDEGDLESRASVQSPWQVSFSKLSDHNQLYIFYKGEEIAKIASASLGIPSDELEQVTDYLPVSLANNQKLVHALLSELSPSAKEEVLKKFPELV